MRLARIRELLGGSRRRRGLQKFAETCAGVREAPRRELDLKRIQRRRDAFHLIIVHDFQYPTNGEPHGPDRNKRRQSEGSSLEGEGIRASFQELAPLLRRAYECCGSRDVAPAVSRDACPTSALVT